MRCFRRGATELLAVSFLLLTAPNAFAQEDVGLYSRGAGRFRQGTCPPTGFSYGLPGDGRRMHA